MIICIQQTCKVYAWAKGGPRLVFSPVEILWEGEWCQVPTAMIPEGSSGYPSLQGALSRLGQQFDAEGWNSLHEMARDTKVWSNGGGKTVTATLTYSLPYQEPEIQARMPWEIEVDWIAEAASYAAEEEYYDRRDPVLS